MKKLLKPGDILLLGLAGVVDIYEEVKNPIGIAAYGAKELYGWVPKRFNKHNLSRVVSNRIFTGDLEKIIKNGQIFLRLTSAGKEKVRRDFPMLSLSHKKWDGKWRVVIFDIAEVNKFARESLRRKLKELGFGMLQESVWVTPHDIGQDMREFLESKKLGAYAFVLEVSGFLAGDKKLLIERIWKLEELNRKYDQILSEVKRLKSMYVTRSDRNMEPTSELLKVREKYLRILMTDPCLPKELLPEDWAGEKVRKAIGK